MREATANPKSYWDFIIRNPPRFFMLNKIKKAEISKSGCTVKKSLRKLERSAE
jgi:hypothetical protein